MNASATVFTMDIYKRYFKPNLGEKNKLFVLHAATVVFGLLGLGTGIAMIGVKSLLDIWWELSGIFAGGMLGLFLLGIISRRTKSHEAFTATLIGIVAILWLTFSKNLPERYAFLRNPLHVNMTIVVGTLTIFLLGLLLTATKRKVKLTLPNEEVTPEAKEYV
jgi:SSS family solute:Na+ symporter